jgi:hypothetical protein
MAEHGLRRHDRVERRVPVQVTWKDRLGNDNFLTGHTVDVSQDGMRLELGAKIAEGTFINFRAEGLKLHGTASVRRCVRQGSVYVIGLQFAGGLQWKAKEPDKSPENTSK